MRRAFLWSTVAFISTSVLAHGPPPPQPPVDPEPQVVKEKVIIDHPDYQATTLTAYFIEQFDGDALSRWSPSEAVKGGKVGNGEEVFSYVGLWSIEEPTIFPGLKGDQGLVVTSQAAHHAISVPLPEPIDPSKEPLVLQYEVKLQNGLECGGAYIKLLTESPEGVQAKEFSDKTPYSIMFGPDRCGTTNKVHLILRHQNSKTGEIEEKHLKSPPAPKTTKTTALYTLILKPDQTYEIKINDESAKSGSLLEDFDPPVNPPKEIDDPQDFKPDDWVDEAKIADPDATKPDDWDEDAPMEIPDDEATMPEGWLEDEPASIPDPEAEKPEEWDDEEDGDWVPPSVPNPKCEEAPGCGAWVRPNKSNPAYKGKWYAPLIDNPSYKGIWSPRRIENPAYVEDLTPLAHIGKIGALGFEIWSMQSQILFDNIYLGSSIADAETFAKETFHVKKAIEDAEEDAAKPALTDADAYAVPSYTKDPIGYIRYKIQPFVDLALVDPMAAIKTYPQTVTMLGGALATIVGMIGFLLTLLAPKSKPTPKKAVSKAKKTDEVVADPKSEEPVKETPLAGDKPSEGPVTRRSGKGKAVATE